MQNQSFTDCYILNWGSVKSWILWLQTLTDVYSFTSFSHVQIFPLFLIMTSLCIILYPWVSKFAYFVQHEMSYHASKFQWKHSSPFHHRIACFIKSPVLKGFTATYCQSFLHVEKKQQQYNFSRCPLAQHLLAVCKQLVNILKSIRLKLNPRLKPTNDLKKRSDTIGELHCWSETMIHGWD